MPETVFGLPVHPLIVHATVVMVPLTAVAVALWFLSARFRAWSGILPLAMAAVSVVLAPLSTSSGEEPSSTWSARASSCRSTPSSATCWSGGASGCSSSRRPAWFLRRRGDLGKGLTVALVVAGVVVSGGTLVQVVLIGHSGAKAAWSDVAPLPAGLEQLGRGRRMTPRGGTAFLS